MLSGGISACDNIIAPVENSKNAADMDTDNCERLINNAVNPEKNSDAVLKKRTNPQMYRAERVASVTVSVITVEKEGSF